MLHKLLTWWNRHFKTGILIFAVMVLLALIWSVYESRNGGYFNQPANKKPTDSANGSYGIAAGLTIAPGSAKALQTLYHGIIDDRRPAVISIDAVVPGQNANPGDPVANYSRIGSGVIIDPRGFALSSLHVVEGASSLKATVYSPTGAMEYPVKIVKAEKTSDLVLLRLLADGPLPHAGLGDSNAVRTGDVVISIGSPFGFEQTVTSGIISSRNRTLNVNGMIYENMLQTDSAINKGSGGGPLLNSKGDVIGINTAIYSTSGTFAGISFAVPINRSLELLAGVIDFQHELPPVAAQVMARTTAVVKQPASFAWLGAAIAPLPAGEKGVYVAESLGLLEDAGVKAGDIIQNINNRPVTDLSSFISLTKKTDATRGILLDVRRSGYNLFIPIKTNIAPRPIMPPPAA